METDILLKLTFTKTWSRGLSCVFVASSLLAIVVDGSESFIFPGSSLIRIVYSTTPASVSLVHGFTRQKCSLLVFDTSSKISTGNWNSYPLIEDTRPSKWLQRRVAFSRPFVDIFSANMERTSVLGSLHMSQQNTKATVPLDVVSERRTGRYSLSPCREGEKCRPLDHAWQIPFVHSARWIIGIYAITF